MPIDRAAKPGQSRWRARTEYDYLLKLVLVGDEGAGKSSLMNRFCEDNYSPSYVATIGVDFKVRSVIVQPDDGVTATVKMQMWDTAGQERFSSITSSFYRGADAVFVLYDITSHQSFLKVSKWLKGCTDVCGEDVTGFLVGNKLDLERHREVTLEQGCEMARKLNMPHFETSAKDDTNVDDLFRQVASQYAVACRAKLSGARAARQRARRGSGAGAGGRVIKPNAGDTGANLGCWAALLKLFGWSRPGITTTGELAAKSAGGRQPAVAGASIKGAVRGGRESLRVPRTRQQRCTPSTSLTAGVR